MAFALAGARSAFRNAELGDLRLARWTILSWRNCTLAGAQAH